MDQEVYFFYAFTRKVRIQTQLEPSKTKLFFEKNFIFQTLGNHEPVKTLKIVNNFFF